MHARKRMAAHVFKSLQLTHAGIGQIFHSGPFKPILQELHVTKPLQVLSGHIPRELDGFYMRTGPNPQFDPVGGYHLFDGEAMIHCVQVKGGEATAYCNHWVRCERFERERKAGHNIYMRIGDMRGIPGLLMIMLLKFCPYNIPEKEHEAKEQGPMGNTALACHNGRILALNEAGYPIEVTVDRDGKITTGDVVRFDGKLQRPFTAHPKVDPATNEMCIFGYELGPGGGVTYSTVSPAGQLSEGTPIDVQRAQLMHDFGITPNYAVFVDQNLVFAPQQLVKESNKLPFAVENSFNARIGLLRRSAVAEGVTWYDVGRPTGWAAHVANAWEDEDGSRVHIVVTHYDDVDLSADDYSLGGGVGGLVRLTVHLGSGRVEWTPLVSDPHLHLDFPVVSPRSVGQGCHFTYLAYSDTRQSDNRAAFDGIAQVDMTARAGEGLCGKIEFPRGFKGSEMSFVPRKAAAAAGGLGPDALEAGYIVGFLTNEQAQISRLAVYDTSYAFGDPCEVPFAYYNPAMVQLPHRIPLGFHGLFVHSDNLTGKAL